MTGNYGAASAAGDGGDVARQVHLANQNDFISGDIHLSSCIHGHASGVDLRIDSRASIAGIALRSVARDGGDFAGRGADHANTIVVRIGDVDIAGKVGGHCGGRAKFSGRGQNVVAVIAVDFTTSSVRDTGKNRPAARGVDLDHDVFIPCCNVKVAGGIEGQSSRREEGFNARAVTVKLGDDAGHGVDLADAVVAVIGDVEVALSVHRDRDRITQSGVERRAAVARSVGLLGAS